MLFSFGIMMIFNFIFVRFSERKPAIYDDVEKDYPIVGTPIDSKLIIGSIIAGFSWGLGG